MSIRAGMVFQLLVIGGLGWPATCAFAQTSGGSTAGNWEIEVHAGGVRMGRPTGATTAMPPPGEPFTTPNGRLSRYESSWFFGDGSTLLNDWSAAFTIVPRVERITPLDAVLTESAARPSNTSSFGVRVGRRLTRRITAEVNVDYGPSSLELSEGTRGDIEASRTTFARVFNEAFAPAQGGFVNPVVSSVSEIDEGDGGRIVTTGALTLKLREGGVLVPYVTGGLGGVFNHGRLPSVTLTGSYSMSPFFNPSARFNQTDTVTVRFTRSDRALAGVMGGGLTFDLSARHGLRVDLRWHITSNTVDTEVNASPLTINGTPVASLGSATTPSVTFTNNAGLRSSLSGPPITAFRTREGTGLQIETTLTIGYFWRF
jgi:hypothetical protein